MACENYRWVDNDGATANPANILFYLAVAGQWAGRYGIDDSKPMQMDIDCVRVFSRASPVPQHGSLRTAGR